MSERQIIVNEIILANKPDFMSKQRLAEELEVSIDTIDRWIKSKFFKFDEHYFIKDRVVRFYYPSIKILLAPNALKY